MDYDEIDRQAEAEGDAISRRFNRVGYRKSYRTAPEHILPEGKEYDELVDRNIIHGRVREAK